MQTATPARWITAVLLSASCAFAGCGKEKDGMENLPPAEGEGAPPAPVLPDLRAGHNGYEKATVTSDETTGTTYAHAEAKLSPNMSGVLSKIYVEEGDRVKKNQVIFRLRTNDIALRLKQAKAALASAQVNTRAVKVEYDRTKRLFEQNAVNAAAWDQVKAQYDAAQAGVDQAKVGVAMARQALADTVVRSPINGVVVHKLANEGEMVTMMPPTVVAMIEDHSVLDLKFRLPERALVNAKPGDELQAVFTAIGDTRTAKIARINPTVDPRTRTVEVVAELDNSDQTLKPGMLAKIELVVDAKKKAAEPEPPAEPKPGAEPERASKPAPAGKPAPKEAEK